MTEEELTAEFGKNGWKQLPDAISRRYRFVPAKVEVEEHHIGVYAGKKDGHMVVFCQALFPEKSIRIPCFRQGNFPAFGGAQLRIPTHEGMLHAVALPLKD